MIFDLCPPALIYFIFCLTQIIIDITNGLYNTAWMKFFIMILVTFLLNLLCKNGLDGISWIIVLVPFVFMSVTVAILLYTFGLDVATGKINSQQIQSIPQPSNINNPTQTPNCHREETPVVYHGNIYPFLGYKNITVCN